MIVVLIILLPVALLITSVVIHVRSRADQLECGSNLRQLVIAMHNYHNDYNRLPYAVRHKSTLPYEERVSWTALVEPYLESNDLILDLPVSHRDINVDMINQYDFKIFRCPSYQLSQRYFTSYVAIAGVGDDAPLLPVIHPRSGVMGYDRAISFNQIEAGNGRSHTLVLGETQQNNGPWFAGGTPTLRSILPGKLIGQESQFSNSHLQSLDPFYREASLRQHFAMADASVRQFSLDTTPQVLQSLAAYRSGYRPEIAPWVDGD